MVDRGTGGEHIRLPADYPRGSHYGDDNDRAMTDPNTMKDTEDDLASGPAHDEFEWNIDAAAKLSRAETAIAEFTYQITKLNYLHAQLLAARDGTLEPDWRATITTIAAETTSEPADTQRSARSRAAADLAAIPPADWEPGRKVGWRTALDAWFDAIKACLADTERAERHLRAETWMSADSVTARITMDRDLATASYRAGLAAGGLDVDWYDWLIERVRLWPDVKRRNDQLDLMTLEPDYRQSIEQLPPYWA